MPQHSQWQSKLVGSARAEALCLGRAVPFHSQTPPRAYANETESYDRTYGRNLRGLFWHIGLNKNKKGKSWEPPSQTEGGRYIYRPPSAEVSGFPAPKLPERKPLLPWVDNRLVYETGALPRNHLPSTQCPGEGLHRKHLPRTVAWGAVHLLSGRGWLPSLAAGGAEDGATGDAQSKPRASFLSVPQKPLGTISP